MPAQEIQKVLARLFVLHGAPAFLRSDNGPEFVHGDLQAWLLFNEAITRTTETVNN